MSYSDKARVRIYGLVLSTSVSTGLLVVLWHWWDESANVVTLLSVIIGVVLGLLALKSIELGFLALVTLVPFVDLLKRLLLLFLPVSQLHWYLVLLVPDIVVILMLFQLAYRAVFLRQKVRWHSGTALAALSLLLLSLAGILALGPRVTLGLAGFKVFAFYVLCYFLGLQFVLTRRSYLRIFFVTYSCAVITSLYGIGQSIWGLASFERVWLYEGYTTIRPETITLFGVTRCFSTFSDHASFAGYLAVSLILLLTYYRMSRLAHGFAPWSALTGAGLVGMSMPLGAALILTFSRGVWMGLVAALLVTWTVSRRRHRRVVVLGLLAIIGGSVIVAPVVSGALRTHFSNPYADRILTLGTFNWRLGHWRGLVQAEGTLTLLGHGTGTLGVAAARFGASEGVSDNIYLKVLYENGLLGLSAFVFFLARCFGSAVALYDRLRGTFEGEFCLGVVGLIAFVAVGGLTAANLEWRPLAVYFWFLCGVLASLLSRHRHVRRRAIVSLKCSGES